MCRQFAFRLFISLHFSGLCQLNESIDISEEIVFPKHYTVTKTTSPITIDGEANEKAWKNAVFTDPFIDIEGTKEVPYRTQVKMLWDEDFLYFYAEMEEPHIWGNLKQRDTIIYWNNDFEIFIDPSNDTRNYAEIEINALNTVWDLHLDKTYRVGGKANFDWNMDDLKSAVKINGTLNDPSDTDESWTLEMAVPMKSLIRLKNKPRTLPNASEIWRINFSRVQWDHDIVKGVYDRKKENGKYLREHN